jgi:hypothetical protein
VSAPGEPAPGPPVKPLQWPSWAPGVDSTLAGLVLLLAFATASFVARNSDVWLHLATGQRLFHGEYFPGAGDPFSYSAKDQDGKARPWVNHSWLTDAASYLLYGGEGKVLSAAKAIVVALAFGLLIAIRRPQYPLWPWAALACVAVLAAAPYFTLRPHVVSMLFLAATLFILFRVPRGANPWRVPVAVGITFWLWANCDAWFFLGPLALVLLVVGELIQANLLSPGADEASDNEPLGRLPDLATLAVALGVGVVACMLNPHLWGVWELPFELVGAPGAEADPRLHAMLLSVSDETFYESAGFGRNVNGVAFAALIVGGALALGFGPGRLRASHVALWIGFLALALYRVAAIPYFAIVAVPLIAAQLNAYSARAELKSWGDPRSRLLWVGATFGRVLCVLAVCALCVLSYPGWLQPETSNAAFTRRVGWGVEPDALQVQAAGQLERWREEGKLPEADRGIIANTELANHVAWFAPREKVFINSHLNHHRPELPEYLKLRRALGLITVKDEPRDVKDLNAVMRQAGAAYLALSDSAGDPNFLRERTTRATMELYGGWNEWSPWYVDGQTAVFGYRAPGAPAPPVFAALRVDPVALAFAPSTRPLPDIELKQPLAQLGWEESFVRPAKVAPPGTAEALAWVRFKAAPQARLARRQSFREAAMWPLLLTQRTVGPALALRSALLSGESRGLFHAPPDDPSAAYDAGAMRACPILALRAARRAIEKDQDHPEPYFALAEALKDPGLPLAESERALGIATAYRQCLRRLPPPDRYRKGQYAMPATVVALGLVDAFLGGKATRRVTVPGPGGRTEEREVTTGFVGMPIDAPGLREFLGDMVVIRREPSGRLVAGRVPLGQFNPNDRAQVVVAGPTVLPIDSAYEAFELAEQYAKVDLPAGEEGRKELERTKKEIQDALVQAHKVYDPVKARGPKLPDLVNAARATSLAGAALAMLADKNTDLGKEYGRDALRAGLLRVALELALGNVENASDLLKDLASPESAKVVEEQKVTPVVQLLRFQTALQGGQYHEAGEVLESLEKQAPTLEAVVAEIAKGKVNPRDLLFAEFGRFPPFVGATLVPTTVFELTLMERAGRALQAREVIAAKMQQDSRFFYRRGVLLLLEGNVPAAKQRFEQATRKAPGGWGLRDLRNGDAEEYLRLIRAAEKKAP